MFQLIRLQQLCRQLKWTCSLTRWQKTGHPHVPVGITCSCLKIICCGKRSQYLYLHYTCNFREGHFCHFVFVLTALKVSPFIPPSYSRMEQICLTSSMDISHGMIILQT